MTLDRIKKALSRGGFVIVAEGEKTIKEGKRVTLWAAPEEPVLDFKTLADDVEKAFAEIPEGTSLVYGNGIISTNACECTGPNVKDPVRKICVQIHMNKAEAKKEAEAS